jgi:hypothetical protein
MSEKQQTSDPLIVRLDAILDANPPMFASGRAALCALIADAQIEEHVRDCATCLEKMIAGHKVEIWCTHRLAIRARWGVAPPSDRTFCMSCGQYKERCDGC